MNTRVPASRRARPFLLSCPLLLLSACMFAPPSDPVPPPSTLVPERRSVEGAIALVEWSWIHQSAAEYDRVLHDEFEYFPIADDDFPWIPEDGWTKSIEMQIARNMFDPTFISEDTGENVDSIEMLFTVVSTRTLSSPPNAVEVRTQLDAKVLWSAGDGATSNVAIDFVIVPDPDEPELFQVLEQRERDLI